MLYNPYMGQTNNIFGKRLKALRDAERLTQAQLAKELKVVPNTISRWETGEYEPSLDQVWIIGRYFGVSITEFFPPATDYSEPDKELVRRLTAAMREADESFEKIGGGTRHRVRDCLLPVLESHGLKLEVLT